MWIRVSRHLRIKNPTMEHFSTRRYLGRVPNRPHTIGKLHREWRWNFFVLTLCAPVLGKVDWPPSSFNWSAPSSNLWLYGSGGVTNKIRIWRNKKWSTLKRHLLKGNICYLLWCIFFICKFIAMLGQRQGIFYSSRALCNRLYLNF